MYDILFVDDEPLIIHAIKSLENWNDYGFNFTYEASNGKKALDILEKHKVDLVLTDIKMPVMNGLDLLANSKNLNYNQPFIILSAHNDFDTVRHAFKLGATDYIVKTKMDIQSLLSIFYSVLNDDSGASKLIIKKDEVNDKFFAENHSHVVKLALDYINQNYMNMISLSVISDYCELSVGYFCNIFSREVGMPFVEYLSTLRIKKAEELLKTTQMKVYQVAEIVGFNSTEHFCRVFKKTTGLSPRSYKELDG